MLRALSTAATGMEAQQTKLDVTSNNIANVSTVGFKKSSVNFSDLMYQTERAVIGRSHDSTRSHRDQHRGRWHGHRNGAQ